MSCVQPHAKSAKLRQVLCEVMTWLCTVMPNVCNPANAHQGFAVAVKSVPGVCRPVKALQCPAKRVQACRGCAILSRLCGS